MSKLKQIDPLYKQLHKLANINKETLDIITQFPILKRPIFDNYSKTNIKKYSKLAPQTQILLLTQAIQNEIDTINYIEYFVKLVSEYDSQPESLETVLVFLKNSVEANYDYIRILLKNKPIGEEFLLQYIDMPLLAIILGEYIAKYGVALDVMLSFPNLRVFIFLSYVWNYNFILHEHFELAFAFAFNNFEIVELKQIITLLIAKTNQESTLYLQNSIINITKLNNRSNNEYNDFVIDIMLTFPNFFKNNFLHKKIVKHINLENTDMIIVLLQKFEIPDAFDNASAAEYISYMYKAEANNFNLYFDKSNDFDLDENDRIKINVLYYYYNRKTKETLSIDCIESKFLLSTEKFYYSEKYINGFSFVDVAYKYNEGDILAFLHEELVYEHEKKIYELQFECLKQFLIKKDIVNQFEEELKKMVFRHKELHGHIFDILSTIKPEYKVCKQIIQASPANIKTLLFLFDQFYGQTTDLDFFYDFMFTFSGVISKTTKYRNDKRFEERLKKISQKSDDIPSNKKIKIEANQTIKNNIQSQNIVVTNTQNSHNGKNEVILYYLECKKEIQPSYELNEYDIKHKDRIIAHVTSLILSISLEMENSTELRNVSTVINIFRCPLILKDILNTIYRFYKVKNRKLCSFLICNVIKDTDVDVFPAKDIVINILEYDNQIFEVFCERLNVENIYDFISCLENIKKYLNTIRKILTEKIKSGKYSLDTIGSILHKLIQKKDMTLLGLTLAYDNSIYYDKISEFALSKLQSGNWEETLQAYKYLRKFDVKLDEDLLYQLIFKRSKLDELAVEILKTIEYKEEHLDRIYEMFFLNPYLYLDILPKIQSCGYSLTTEMIMELVIILKNVYNEDRDKIYNIINHSEIDNKLNFTLAIVKDLDEVNQDSKLLCLKLLKKNYISEYSVFIVLIKVLANEDNLECMKIILDILKSNKKSFYDKIEEYKAVDKLQRLMFRIYPLVLRDKNYYQKLCKRFKNCFEYDLITKFYNLK